MHFEWVAPTLFISASLWSQNPMAVSIALNVISNYITEFFKGSAGTKSVKLEIIVERKTNYSCKKLKYQGDVSGVLDLAKTIEGIASE